MPADRLVDDRAGRRPLLRFCLDWSEQRHHLAGRLGAELLTALLDAGWITRTDTRRTIRLTPDGSHGLRQQLGLEL